MLPRDRASTKRMCAWKKSSNVGLRLHESERDHVAREVERAGGKPEDEFPQWYTRLGGDDTGWDRKRLERKAVVDIFDRIAAGVGLEGTVLSRKQFLNYAGDAWVKGKSPPWRDPPAFETALEAEKLFRRLDHDRDGYLSADEISPPLRGGSQAVGPQP